MNGFKDALSRFFGKLVNKIANEPVFLATVGIIALQTFQSAQAGGLSFEDALIAAAVAVFGLLARELVYPAVKVDAATSALKAVEEPLAAPYLGEPVD